MSETKIDDLTEGDILAADSVASSLSLYEGELKAGHEIMDDGEDWDDYRQSRGWLQR